MNFIEESVLLKAIILPSSLVPIKMRNSFTLEALKTNVEIKKTIEEYPNIAQVMSTTLIPIFDPVLDHVIICDIIDKRT